MEICIHFLTFVWPFFDNRGNFRKIIWGRGRGELGFSKECGSREGVSSATINAVPKSPVTANFLDNEIESQDLLFIPNFAVLFLFDSKFY